MRVFAILMPVHLRVKGVASPGARVLGRGWGHSRSRCAGSRSASIPPVTWDAFRHTALGGLSGRQAGQRLGIPVVHVFVAKNRVQKLLQEEIRIRK
jgi:hypothetical protein